MTNSPFATSTVACMYSFPATEPTLYHIHEKHMTHHSSYAVY